MSKCKNRCHLSSFSLIQYCTSDKTNFRRFWGERKPTGLTLHFTNLPGRSPPPWEMHHCLQTYVPSTLSSLNFLYYFVHCFYQYTSNSQLFKVISHFWNYSEAIDKLVGAAAKQQVAGTSLTVNC